MGNFAKGNTSADQYKIGYVMGEKYRIDGVLGKGGFGIVYLVYSKPTNEFVALKTFQDDFLKDAEIRNRFHKEASVWIELGRHPNIVQAKYIDEWAERLYIVMEMVYPNERGINSLQGYLEKQPPDFVQSLRWALHICDGMDYACSRGVRAHRDLKPANILINKELVAKISDFGLAGVLAVNPINSFPTENLTRVNSEKIALTSHGKGFGTPTHMAPEQFDNAVGCDQRSDIYSFGVILFQMAAEGALPFQPARGDRAEVDYWHKMKRLHAEAPLPRLASPLFPIIQRCLAKVPEKRYQTFREVRADLESLLHKQTGETILPGQREDMRPIDWVNKGYSLSSLGRDEEAIYCYDQVLKLAPDIEPLLVNKGNSLNHLGRYAEALDCLDHALEINPNSVAAWNNRGMSLSGLQRQEEAVQNYDQALLLDPQHITSLLNKASCLMLLKRYPEAVACCDQALKIDSYSKVAWYNRGMAFQKAASYSQALDCYTRVVELDPSDGEAWRDKGVCLARLGRHEQALLSYDQSLKYRRSDAILWYDRALSADACAGNEKEAVQSYREFLGLATTLHSKEIEYARQRLKALGASRSSQ
jgi:eukaryotic-like serine/threonine-protein kinase